MNGRPLADLTDQQLMNYRGEIDDAVNSGSPGLAAAIRAGEIAVAEHVARWGRP